MQLATLHISGTNPVDLWYPSYMPYDEDTGLCFLRMTPDAVSPRAASAFLAFSFKEDNPKKAFSMGIGYRIFGDEGGSADGMAFVMHQDERGVFAIGEPGGAMGVYGTAYAREGASSAIKPALVVEWDTREFLLNARLLAFLFDWHTHEDSRHILISFRRLLAFFWYRPQPRVFG